MGDRPSGDLGRRLREARERRGLSLRQIANTTKIGVGALEALERNDFSRLPGGIFGRAFVRSYALEVGLDPDATLDEFIRLQPHGTAHGRPALLQPEDHEAVESDRHIATTFVRLAVMSVPLAIAIAYFGSVGRPAARAAGSLAAGGPASGQPAPSAAEAIPRARSVEVDRLTVSLLAVRDSRVAATIDSGTAFERQMKAGEQQTLEVRRELLLTTDDASSLAVTINGAPVRPLGGPGQAVTARLNLTNFKEYLVSP